VQQKAGRAGTLADSQSFQEQFAKAEAVYRSARAFVYETWSGIEETLARGDRPSVRQHTLMRLALAHATWSSHEAAMFAYTAAGTTALRAGALQRLFRDMHAGTQHITSAPPVYGAIGRELAGLAPNRTWVFLDLVQS
jgi:alkylation response protein AidB-like acyl-CoA dehydrogenase